MRLDNNKDIITYKSLNQNAIAEYKHLKNIQDLIKMTVRYCNISQDKLDHLTETLYGELDMYQLEFISAYLTIIRLPRDDTRYSELDIGTLYEEFADTFTVNLSEAIQEELQELISQYLTIDKEVEEFIQQLIGYDYGEFDLVSILYSDKPMHQLKIWLNKSALFQDSDYKEIVNSLCCE